MSFGFPFRYKVKNRKVEQRFKVKEVDVVDLRDAIATRPRETFQNLFGQVEHDESVVLKLAGMSFVEWSFVRLHPVLWLRT